MKRILQKTLTGFELTSPGNCTNAFQTLQFKRGEGFNTIEDAMEYITEILKISKDEIEVKK